MDNPKITDIPSSRVATWGVDIPVEDGETIQEVLTRECPEGVALFTTPKPADKNWDTRLYLRIQETDK